MDIHPNVMVDRRRGRDRGRTRSVPPPSDSSSGSSRDATPRGCGDACKAVFKLALMLFLLQVLIPLNIDICQMLKPKTAVECGCCGILNLHSETEIPLRFYGLTFVLFLVILARCVLFGTTNYINSFIFPYREHDRREGSMAVRIGSLLATFMLGIQVLFVNVWLGLSVLRGLKDLTVMVGVTKFLYLIVHFCTTCTMLCCSSSGIWWPVTTEFPEFAEPAHKIGIFITFVIPIIFLTAIAATALGVVATATSSSTSEGTTGCGKTHLLPNITTYHGLTSSGRDRSYSIHLPANYSESTPYPVVLGFHGSSSIGLFFEADTKLSEARFSANKIMVYPNGIGGAWAGANYSEVSVDEDLQFVSDLLSDVRGSYCVDDSRIFATGMSIGGGFVNTIACSSTGAQFAAFAPASGSFYTDDDAAHGNCTPARSPLPVLEIHGGSDASVYYAGGAGEGGEEPGIPTWLGWWAQRNGCDDGGKTVEDSFGGDVHHTSWTCGAAEGALQHWKVDDMGHCWASTEINFSQIAAGEGPTHIQASQIIMDFFDQFTKP
ncbi:Alpha/Beta hydrolase protein [Jackrogersella minutella]|nr:Alpha/Beta hydrolase protein [Jackrogersella minutella]